MNIEQKELINIIREELAEVLGMDAQDDRQNLTMKVRNLLEDEEYGSGRDKVYDDERAADERGDPAHPQWDHHYDEDVRPREEKLSK